jgi:hypothetical protein
MSSRTVITVVLLAVVGLSMIALFVSNYRRDRALAQGMAASVASAMSTTVQRTTDGWTMEGVLSGCPVRTSITLALYLRDIDDRGPMFIPEVDISVPSATNVRLDIRYRRRDYRNILRHAWRRLASPHTIVTTDDEDFDREFSIRGEPAAEVRAVLDGPTRRALLSFRPGFGSHRWRLYIDQRRVGLRRSFRFYDVEPALPEIEDDIKRSTECICRMAAIAARTAT